MRKIRVLVVEDSIMFRELLVSSINKDPALTVVGTAGDPFEARDKIIECSPDVMTLDIEMPRMDGIEFVRKLMPQYPIPVIMVSSLSDKVFDALQAGAVDFVVNPDSSDKNSLESFLTRELPVKIKVASTASIGKIKNGIRSRATNTHFTSQRNMIVAIGASTGGTEAIAEVIKGFGPDIPGTVIVQHMPVGFTDMFARRLNDQTRVCVKEAKNGDVVLPGTVLIAPGGNQQMRVIRVGNDYQVSLRDGHKVNGHCPSVDVLFDSVASVAGKNALGIILTGMGGDGAQGLLKMKEAGAMTIGQDESSCVVYGMPKVAYEIGAVQYQEKLGNIAKKTYMLLNNM